MMISDAGLRAVVCADKLAPLLTKAPTDHRTVNALISNMDSLPEQNDGCASWLGA
jgi:hypothetical protein